MAVSQDVRRRNLFWINASTFSWNLGLGASIPVVPLLAYQFVPDLALAGFVVAIGGLARLFTGYFTGPLVDRFGRLGVSRIGVFIRMVFSFMEGLSGSYVELVIYRFFSSVGTSVYGTSVTVMMADIATRRDRGSIAGGRTSLAQMGNVLGPVVGGALWAFTGDLRTPFLFNGFTKLVCMAIFLLFVKETKGYETEPAPPAAAPAAAAAPGPAPTATATPAAHFSVRDMLFTGPFFLTLYAGFAAALFQQGVQYTVLAVYVQKVLELPQGDIGLILGSIGLGQLLVGFPSGRMVDRWGIRAGIIPGALLSAATLGYLAVTSAAGIPWGLVMGAGTGLMTVTAAAYAMDIAPAGARGHFFGINQSAQSFANLVGPLIVGFVTDHLGYNAAFGMVAFMFALTAPMGLAWVRDRAAA
jgi:MFS family permease